MANPDLAVAGNCNLASAAKCTKGICKCNTLNQSTEMWYYKRETFMELLVSRLNFSNVNLNEIWLWFFSLVHFLCFLWKLRTYSKCDLWMTIKLRWWYQNWKFKNTKSNLNSKHTKKILKYFKLNCNIFLYSL